MTVSKVFPVFNGTIGITGPTWDSPGRCECWVVAVYLPTVPQAQLSSSVLLLELRLWFKAGAEGGQAAWVLKAPPLSSPKPLQSQCQKTLHNGLGCQKPGIGLERLKWHAAVVNGAVLILDPPLPCLMALGVSLTQFPHL